MSEQEYKANEQGLVKPYLHFLDTNVLFRKPVSCLAAIVSLLIPIFTLSQFIRFGVFESNEVKLVFAAILIIVILAFAGIFGAFIWWHRRITRDEGPKWYDNFRRFIKTSGEWLGTFFAISVFGIIIVLMIFLSESYQYVTDFLPFQVPSINIAVAFLGPIGGFLIIIATKILLFLLDPIIWFIKQIWFFIKWIVVYCYRFIISFLKTFEKNTSFWVGITWILAVAVIIATLTLCFKVGGIAPVIGLAAALAFMGYLLFKRKHYDI